MQLRFFTTAAVCGMASIVTVFPAVAQAQSQTYRATQLNGGYTYTLAGYAANPDSGGDDLIVEAGRMLADSAGNVSGSDTVMISGDPVRRTFTGNYTVNQDGTGTLTLNPSFGPQIHADIVAGNGGRFWKLMLTDSGNTLSGNVEAQDRAGQTTLPSYNAGILTGGYEYKTSGYSVDSDGNTSPITEIGLLTMDGSGNVTGSSTLSVDGYVMRRTFTGTYTVNPDGTGSVSLYPTWGPQLNADLFVSSNGAKVDFVVTDVATSVAGVMSAQVLAPVSK